MTADIQYIEFNNQSIFIFKHNIASYNSLYCSIDFFLNIRIYMHQTLSKYVKIIRNSWNDIA
jgi:hypothetical protein